ncbi:hypothetical protein Goklo_012803, partial [Gossypium klotzschianum]|nr:hypothetical protein [Gossypium klotzschianum]
MKQLHKQSSMNHRRDEETPSTQTPPYSPKSLKHPKSIPRSINYLFKEQRLLFILIGILIGSTFFILQPSLSRLGPTDAHSPIRRSFSKDNTVSSGVSVVSDNHDSSASFSSGTNRPVYGKLIARGDEVIVLDNFFTGRKDNLVHLFGNPMFELIRHDVVEPILLEVDQIYHLACPASPVHYKYNPVKTIISFAITNVMGTLNMLGLAKRVGARFLLTSTSEVYGDPLQHPQKETYWGNVNPIGERSCYDEGKRTAETLAMDYHRGAGVE